MFDFKAWVAEFQRKPVEPMTKETTTAFLSLLMSEEFKKEIDDEIKKTFLYRIIDSRADHIGLKLTDQLKTFLMFATKSPGSAVMYLYVLRSKSENMTMQDLAILFPMGFPSDDSLQEMWDLQKGYVNGETVDNCLDNCTLTF